MREVIQVNMPQIGVEEIKAVSKVLRSRVLTGRFGSGPMAKEFEERFADFVNARHAIAVNSGTAALHLALWVAGIKADDEVIVPSFTFIASAESIALAGARPVFVDIDPRSYNIETEKIEDAITQKTKAIMPVDLYGLPAEMDTVKEIAEKHKLIVIEDAAQAHGASYKGKPPGHYADLACWSFYASKNMTTGEGGMITTCNDRYAKLLRVLRSHGETDEYVSTMVGHNYRMPEIEAAIGIAQLKKLPTFIEKRRKNAELLTEKLSGMKRLFLPKEPKASKHSWYLYTVRLKDGNAVVRNKIVEKMRKMGVNTAVYYHTPLHQMPYYKQFRKHSLPNTERIAKQVFSLPVHPGVTAEDIDYTARSLRKAMKNLART